ncbi:Uncharacterised protein [Mycobacteroides abscessus subsp. abscessus]|nr:Uncharacterised protein [Mycobacteroides abscessus subsp. abscessus]
MPMGRVDHNRIGTGIKQSLRPIKGVRGNANRCCNQQTAMRIFSSMREFNHFFNILDRNQPTKAAFLIDQR